MPLTHFTAIFLCLHLHSRLLVLLAGTARHISPEMWGAEYQGRLPALHKRSFWSSRSLSIYFSFHFHLLPPPRMHFCLISPTKKICCHIDRYKTRAWQRLAKWWKKKPKPNVNNELRCQEKLLVCKAVNRLLYNEANEFIEYFIHCSFTQMSALSCCFCFIVILLLWVVSFVKIMITASIES